MTKVVIWGTENKGQIAFNKISFFSNYQVIAFADNNKNKVGKEKCNLPIWGEEDVISAEFDALVIASAYHKEIKEQLINKISVKIYDSYESLIKKCVIDISGWCNAKCKYCSTGVKNREAICQPRYMDINLFKKIYYHLKSINMEFDEFILYNWGEPFLNPDYIKIIEFLDSQSQVYSISTNGSIIKLASKESTYRLCKTATFSLSGFSKETYSYIHGFDLDIVLENMKIILRNMKECGFNGEANLAFHVYRFNENEVFEAQKFSGENGFHFIPYYAYLASYKLSRGYLKRENDELKELDKELFLDYLPDLIKNKKYIKCPLSEDLTISCDGKIELCCLTDEFCEDYYWDEIFSISSKEHWKQYRKKMMNSNTCKECQKIGLNYWIFNEPSYSLGDKLL